MVRELILNGAIPVAFLMLVGSVVTPILKHKLKRGEEKSDAATAAAMRTEQKTDATAAAFREIFNRAQKQLDAATKDLRDTRVELRETRGELEDVRKELRETLTELERTISELELTRGDLESTRRELDGTRALLQQQSAELQTAHQIIAAGRRERDLFVAWVQSQKKWIKDLVDEVARLGGQVRPMPELEGCEDHLP